MSFNAMGVQELANINKRKLKNKYFVIPVNGEKYKFKISGIGRMTIKLEKFFYYSEIVNAVKKGNDKGFEFFIEQVIVDPVNKTRIPNIEDSFELRERALANKSNLKTKYVNVIIGCKEYGFRISGIGAKSIKLELYVGYEDIVKVVSAGNNNSIEFLLLELLQGNEIDYGKFDETPQPIEVIDEEPPEAEIDINDFEKLSEDELDEIASEFKGFEKLVFDSIEDIFDDIFTLDALLNQSRIKAYQVVGEDLKSEVCVELDKFEGLGLISKVDDRYVKLF